MNSTNTSQKTHSYLRTTAWFTLTLSVLLGIFACTYRNPEQEEKQKDEEALLLSLLVATPFQASCPTNVTATTFADVSARAAVTGCTNCHSGSNLNAGFDVNNGAAAQARIVANDPQNGIYYRKVAAGSMAQYSDATFNATLLNWICSGGSL